MLWWHDHIIEPCEAWWKIAIESLGLFVEPLENVWCVGSIIGNQFHFLLRKYSSNLAQSWPPSVSPTRSLMASKCISKLVRSRPASVSQDLLNHGLQVRTMIAPQVPPQTRSIMASQSARSWPRTAHVHPRSTIASKCISKLARSWPPSVSPHSLHYCL